MLTLSASVIPLGALTTERKLSLKLMLLRYLDLLSPGWYQESH